MYVIILKSKKETKFLEKAKTVLGANGYQEINENTFIGQQVALTIVNQLKNLKEYKSDKVKCGIEIYYGSISKIWFINYQVYNQKT